MFSPSSNTRPVIHPPSVSSCIRLRQRRKVDLPQPDGPINACTRLGENPSDTLFTAANFPYIAVSFSVTTRSAAWAAGLVRSGTRLSVNSATEGRPPVDREPGPQAQQEHHQNEDQRRGPGIAVPFLVRTGGTVEHGERQRRHRPIDIEAEVLAAHRGKEERRGLPGNSGNGEQGSGGYAGQSGSDHHRQAGSPAGIPQRQGSLPE